MGIAYIGAQSGATVFGLGGAALVPTLAGAVALVWCAWRFGGLSARLSADGSPLRPIAYGAVGAVECMLVATLAVFVALLTLGAFGMGGQWGAVAGFTELAAQKTPGAAIVATVLGTVWGVVMAITRRRAS